MYVRSADDTRDCSRPRQRSRDRRDDVIGRRHGNNGHLPDDELVDDTARQHDNHNHYHQLQAK